MKKETVDQTYRLTRWILVKATCEQRRTAGLESVVRTMLPESASSFDVRHTTGSMLMVYGKNDECEPLLRKLLTEAEPGEQHSKILDELACIPIYRKWAGNAGRSPRLVSTRQSPKRRRG